MEPIRVKNNETGEEYVLTYTRASVKRMEQQGFKYSRLINDEFSLTGLEELFAGAFIANHPRVKLGTIDEILKKIGKRQELFARLVEMLVETISDFFGDDEEDGKNAEWEASW